MKQRKIFGVILLGSSLAFEQGCWWKKEPRKATIVIPPAPQPAPPPQFPPPPQLPPSSNVPALKGNTELPNLPVPATAEKPKRPKPARKPSSSLPPSTPQVDPAVEAPNLPPVSPGAAPSLQPILATQEVSERSKRIQQYLERARVTVLRAERGNPDVKAKELIMQVRTFIQQAEESRKTDLVRAENLAERAEVLSRSLK